MNTGRLSVQDCKSKQKLMMGNKSRGVKIKDKEIEDKDRDIGKLSAQGCL